MISSPQWKPPRSNGSGVGACNARHAVSGSDSCLAKVANDRLVSPRPWRRMRMLTGLCGDGGGMMARLRLGGKSDEVGRRPGMLVVRLPDKCRPPTSTSRWTRTGTPSSSIRRCPLHVPYSTSTSMSRVVGLWQTSIAKRCAERDQRMLKELNNFMLGTNGETTEAIPHLLIRVPFIAGTTQCVTNLEALPVRVHLFDVLH